MVSVLLAHLPRGGHYFFLAHHLGTGALVVLFVVLLGLAIANSRRR